VSKDPHIDYFLSQPGDIVQIIFRFYSQQYQEPGLNGSGDLSVYSAGCFGNALYKCSHGLCTGIISLVNTDVALIAGSFECPVLNGFHDRTAGFIDMPAVVKPAMRH